MNNDKLYNEEDILKALIKQIRKEMEEDDKKDIADFIKYWKFMINIIDIDTKEEYRVEDAYYLSAYNPYIESSGNPELQIFVKRKGTEKK